MSESVLKCVLVLGLLFAAGWFFIVRSVTDDMATWSQPGKSDATKGKAYVFDRSPDFADDRPQRSAESEYGADVKAAVAVAAISPVAIRVTATPMPRPPAPALPTPPDPAELEAIAAARVAAREEAERRETVAAGKLRLAEQYVKLQQVDKADGLLQEVIDDYAETPAAQTARELLAATEDR